MDMPTTLVSSFHAGEMLTMRQAMRTATTLVAGPMAHPPSSKRGSWWISTRTQRLLHEVVTITRSTINDDEKHENDESKSLTQNNAFRELLSTTVYMHTLLQCYRMDDAERQQVATLASSGTRGSPFST
ncbi:hypothetical protein PINS_up016506 [Pythium insidiosum]|nr:hypothetical protein PINS_up016506 [Pythium insidiosum]